MPAYQSFICGVLAGILWLTRTDVVAQQPVFQARLESDEVVEGSRFEISFILQNTTGRAFNAPDLRPFRVVSGPNEMTGMGFVNGKSYKHQSWTYVLEAGKPGLYAIGAARVNAQGEVLRTQPLQIRVKPSTSGRGAPDREDALFIQGEFSAKEAFVGQQVIYRIVLYTRLTVSNPELLSMPQTDKAYSRELRRFDTRTRYGQIRGQQYAVRTLYEMAVFPQEAGRLEITPVHMRVGVEQAGSVGAFFGPKPVLLQTQSTALEVKPLPVPEPAAFCGGVGQYEWKVGVDREQISTDDAVTLTIVLQGNGDSRRVSPPKIEAPDGMEIHEPQVREEEEYEQGDGLTHSRTYDYILLPQKNGRFDIRPVLHYFDPDSSRYIPKTLEVPIQIVVEPGKSFSQDPSEDAFEKQSNRRSSLIEWLNARRWWLLVVFAGCGIGAWIVFRQRRQSKNTRPATIPEPASMDKKAADLSALREQAGSGDAVLFYDRLYHSLLKQLGTRFGLPPAQWSAHTLAEQMHLRGYAETDIEQVCYVLNACEQVLFAGQDRSAQTSEMWQKASKILQHTGTKKD